MVSTRWLRRQVLISETVTREITIHARSYIICATPRSGSTLLCDLLADTNVAGCPNSFFRRQSYSDWALYFNLSTQNWANKQAFDQHYLNAVIREGTKNTHIFGMRLMWESVIDLSDRLADFYPEMRSDNDRFRSAFGAPLYIHLSRQDKVAQAVSDIKAEQTGLWHVHANGSERERIKTGQAPVYDSRQISAQVTELENHEKAWEAWFSKQEIKPLRITYEALAIAPQKELAKVLSSLNLDPAVARHIKPRTARLADDVNQQWITRFKAEQHHNPSSKRS